MNKLITKCLLLGGVSVISLYLILANLQADHVSASSLESTETYAFHPDTANGFYVLCGDHREFISLWDGNLFLPTQTTDFYPAEGNVTDPETINVVRSSSVATIFVTLKDDSFDVMNNTHEKKASADATILQAEGGILFDGSLEYIKTRGNGTFNTEKKPYEIKFGKNIGLLGMDPAKEWILLANAYDGSLMKNKLVQDYAEDYTDLIAAECVPVDLYINGEYRGSYYLSEKVEVRKNRIDILDLEEANEQLYSKGILSTMPRYASDNIGYVSGAIDPGNISGGYLIEMIQPNLLDDTVSYFRTDNDTLFRLKTPKYATQSEAEYIQALFNELEGAVASEAGINPQTGRHFTEIIDVTSWLEKYLLEMMFQNPDQNYGSMYFYKNSDLVDGLLYAGTPWDYDLILNSTENGETAPFLYDMYLRDELLSHEEVMEEYVKLYESVCKPFVEKDLKNLLNSYEEVLSDSFKMNSIRWATLPKTNDFSSGYSTLSANADYIYYRMKISIEAMDKWIYTRNQYCTLEFNDTKETYLVPYGEPANIKAPAYTNYAGIFVNWVDEFGDPYDPNNPVTENCVYSAYMLDVGSLLSRSVDPSQATEFTPEVKESINKLAKSISQMR